MKNGGREGSVGGECGKVLAVAFWVMRIGKKGVRGIYYLW